MAYNPKFDTLLDFMKALHAKKGSDYAEDSDPYSNFRHAAEMAGTDIDTVFRVMIGIKVARLNVLLGSGKPPENESVQDTRVDLAMYCALWASYHLIPGGHSNPDFIYTHHPQPFNANTLQ